VSPIGASSKPCVSVCLPGSAPVVETTHGRGVLSVEFTVTTLFVARGVPTRSSVAPGNTLVELIVWIELQVVLHRWDLLKLLLGAGAQSRPKPDTESPGRRSDHVRHSSTKAGFDNGEYSRRHPAGPKGRRRPVGPRACRRYTFLELAASRRKRASRTEPSIASTDP